MLRVLDELTFTLAVRGTVWKGPKGTEPLVASRASNWGLLVAPGGTPADAPGTFKVTALPLASGGSDPSRLAWAEPLVLLVFWNDPVSTAPPASE